MFAFLGKQPFIRMFFLTLLAMAVTTGSAARAAGPQPLSPQPAPEDLSSGLSVLYYYHLFRHVDEIIEWKDYKDGKEGKPIAKLDYRVGLGNVLTSPNSDGVGAEISGLIHFDQPGSWAFSVQSNDGIRLEIGGVMVLEDPDVHADRFSNIATIEIPEAGWYPIYLLYFERKNTSTIEFYWQPPSQQSGSMRFVPADALAHVAP